MQRLMYLCTRTSRLIQVVGGNHLNNSKSLFGKSNTNILNIKRCLATEDKNPKDIDTHPDLYKASTTKEETHIPDDLHSGQPPETFMTTTQDSVTGGGKVWSTQNSDGVHIAPLGQVQATKFVAKSTKGGQGGHETTVYSTEGGDLNLADSFKSHTLKPEATAGELAEAEAASAFETFAPDTPLTSAPPAEAVFAPKVSSTDVYSTTASPTEEFDTTAPTATKPEPVKYEVADTPKVFGGQDTSADSKKHSTDNPFDSEEQRKGKKVNK